MVSTCPFSFHPRQVSLASSLSKFCQVDMKAKQTHECTLSTRAISTGLFPLPPNSSCIRRLLRKLRTLTIMDLNNFRSKEFFRNKSTMLLEQKRHARSRHSCVIHPFSKLNNILEVMFFCAWLWRYFHEPVIRGVYIEYYIVHNLAGSLINYMQYIVFISFFFVGYVDYRKKEIIIEPKKINLHYLKTYLVFDLMAIFSIDLLIFELVGYKDPNQFYKLDVSTTMLRNLAYFGRFSYFLGVFGRITRMLRLSKTTYRFLFHMMIINLTIHTFSCALFAIPAFCYGIDYPDDSWLVQAKVENFITTPFTFLYTECLLLAFCYFFGVSHQKYVITQPNEEITLTVITIIGRLYTLFVIADLLKSFGVVGVSESKYEQYMGQLEEFMSSKHLPEELRVRLVKYYEFKLQKRYFNEGQILNTLSETLRMELYLYGARKLIENASVLRSLPRSTLGLLFSHMKSETFLPTDVITRIGGKVENVYFISTGTVAVINANDDELCHLEDGEEFGNESMWSSAGVGQMFMHVAVETSDIYYISKRMLMEFLSKHPELIKYFESRVKKRIMRYKTIQDNLVKGGDDIISSLRSGKLLERQTIRTVNIE